MESDSVDIGRVFKTHCEGSGRADSIVGGGLAVICGRVLGGGTKLANDIRNDPPSKPSRAGHSFQLQGPFLSCAEESSSLWTSCSGN